MIPQTRPRPNVSSFQSSQQPPRVSPPAIQSNRPPAHSPKFGMTPHEILGLGTLCLVGAAGAAALLSGVLPDIKGFFELRTLKNTYNSMLPGTVKPRAYCLENAILSEHASVREWAYATLRDLPAQPGWKVRQLMAGLLESEPACLNTALDSARAVLNSEQLGQNPELKSLFSNLLDQMPKIKGESFIAFMPAHCTPPMSAPIAVTRFQRESYSDDFKAAEAALESYLDATGVDSP